METACTAIGQPVSGVGIKWFQRMKEGLPLMGLQIVKSLIVFC